MEIVEMKKEIIEKGWAAEGAEMGKTWKHKDYPLSVFTIKGAYDLTQLGRGADRSKEVKSIKKTYDDKGMGLEKSEKKTKSKK